MRRGLVVAVAVVALAGVALVAVLLGRDDAGGSCLAGSLPPAVATDGPPAVPPLEGGAGAEPESYEVEVLARFPHATDAFTQGLLVHEGLVFEGTGGYGSSDVRAVDLGTGDVLAEEALAGEVFGEGLALHGEQLYQLTWQDGEGYLRDPCTLEQTGTFSYEGEGWGLASDGAVLWRSDGTSTLHAHDPDGFGVLDTVEVLDRGVPVEQLNELEVVGEDLFANVWLTDRIARIDPASGAVTGWVDASALAEEVGAGDPDDVLNGIAVSPDGERLWLTGKRWPTVFEVRLVPGGELPAPGGS